MWFISMVGMVKESGINLIDAQFKVVLIESQANFILNRSAAVGFVNDYLQNMAMWF